VTGYVGRYAPSPTGPLHAGSMATALASWLDARAHGGRWLLRIEDIDGPRCVPGMDGVILAQLAACGLIADEPPLYQSARGAAYADALQRLAAAGCTYPCGCSRKDLQQEVYPGTCRQGLAGKPARAMRLRTDALGRDIVIAWHDRRLGAQQQNLTREVGDFVVRRADGPWAYQLAVVVDDAAQGITDIVRGADLADNTARQIHLQQLLGLPRPRYLHAPLVLATDGSKLSKQTGAIAVDTTDPMRVLNDAARVLELPPLQAHNLADWLTAATAAWGRRWVA
jgi:glutamyl-Q tRNA(Asp) synthetase